MNAFLVALALAAPPDSLIFEAPGFPLGEDAPPLTPIEGAQIARSTAELIEGLTADRLLVWRHGATFPAAAWPAFLRFLETGGSFVHLGGEPFTRPVVEGADGYVVEPRTVSLLKELRLNQSYRLDVGAAEVTAVQASGELIGATTRTLTPDAVAFVLEPRFSDTRDFAHEDGAPGSRDATLHPLAFVHPLGADPRFPIATAAFAIDRLLGRFAGGRWVFYLLNSAPTDAETARLLAEARRESRDLQVDPTFGCFHDGERPSLTVRMHRPRARDIRSVAVRGVLRRPDDQVDALDPITIEAGTHGIAQVALPGEFPPGLYRIELETDAGEAANTGFWMMDRDLFESGDEITFDRSTMRRRGVAEPVIGTTLMSKSVHRKFLFEPNAAVWDDSFAELAAIDVNLVRTGIWSAYRKISLDPGVIDEAFLRALEAYYLSARKHGIPVLFTFFSFVPEDFGGASPYFDPRAIDAQQAYVHAIASRFRHTKEMLFDLINEPSFASPDRLWSCRPHGDAAESSAFLAWLQARYSDDKSGRSFEDVVRARWRLRPDEAPGLPTEDDFLDRQVFEDHRPYRAKDWILFAQYAFGDWARTMTTAIRSAGSDAAITVGQDEGGLIERPGPLFHDELVDFTSIHTWWFNDHLGWDALFAKAPGRPLLVSETGIMQREQLSGTSLRTPRGSAELLERKLALSFFGGAFGAVEWCYDVNPYMASDNEVAIGIRRADLSFKPEHAVLARYARFFARNRARFDTPIAPSIAMIMPSSDHWGPRAMQQAGTQRVQALLGGDVQIVHEHRTREHLGAPALIVIPACRGISEVAWQDVLQRVEAGAVLHVSGWFENDDAGLPAMRVRAGRRALAVRESRDKTPGARSAYVSFSRDVTESWFAADLGEDGWVRVSSRGKGRIRHYALPLEWSSDRAPLEEALTGSLRSAGITTVASAVDPGLRPTTRRIRYRDVDLWISVNETSAPIDLIHRELGSGVPITVPAGRAVLITTRPDGEILDRLDEE